jgi:hypothetical protein
MKIRLSFAIALGTLGLFVGEAAAAPYLGFDVDAKSLNLEPNQPATYPQSGLGVNLHGGYRYNNLAGELGYGFVRGEVAPNNLRLNQLTLDGLYYVPVGGFLNLVLTAGAAETNYGDSSFITTSVQRSDGSTKSQRQGITQFGGDELDWRAGGGISFNLLEGYELHFLTRYQPLSLGRRADYALTVNVGMNFYF